MEDLAPPEAPLPIEGRRRFIESLQAAFESISREPVRELWLSDRDFEDWPIGSAVAIEQFTRWVRPHRRLVMLAADFTPLLRRHPRWVDWRRRYAHVVSCRMVDAADADSIPCMLLAPPKLAIQLRDRERWRGVQAEAATDIGAMRLELEAFLQRSCESFPATTLGL